MAKALFRFLRGELNGYYITNINNMLNLLTEENKKFFLDFLSMQMEQGKISATDLYNLGVFAGIRLPRISKSDAVSSLRLSESEYNEELDYEFSERGLFNTDEEGFEFEQETLDTTGLPDINTLATDKKRSSMVGTEAREGYIAEDTTDVLDEEGNVVPSAVVDTPPQNKAYSDFYGNKFLFLSDMERVYIPVSYGVFLDLFKAIQYIRYNGNSVKSLAKVIEVLCPERFVTIHSISVANDNKKYIITYTVDFNSTLDLKQDRLSMLLYTINIKFPQVLMQELI